MKCRGLCDQARTAAANGKPEQAETHDRNALDLWRGLALDGIESNAIRQAAAALDEEHLQALEERIDVKLSLGAAGELVAYRHTRKILRDDLRTDDP